MFIPDGMQSLYWMNALPAMRSWVHEYLKRLGGIQQFYTLKVYYESIQIQIKIKTYSFL